MKYKHSPNFHTNLEEADNANNNRAATFFWTVVFITTLMLLFSITKTKAQSSEDTLVINPYYRVMTQPNDSSKLRKFIYSDTSRYFIGTVTDDGSPVKIRTADTIPVVMMVSDTTIERNDGLKENGEFYFSLKIAPTYTIYGYKVTTIAPILFESGQRFYPGMPTTENKTIYLNHLKQPLQDRIIVWMTIRRNDK